jgi:hypothetical protein
MFKITKRASYKIEFSWLTIIKPASVLVLIAIQCIYLIRTNDNISKIVYYTTHLLLISTFVLVLLFMCYERKNGYRFSTLLFIFWLLLFMSSLISLRSKIYNQILKFQNDNSTLRFSTNERKYSKTSSSNDHFDFIIFVINVLAILCCLILSFISEKFVEIDSKVKSPEYTAPLLSQLSFWWINS